MAECAGEAGTASEPPTASPIPAQQTLEPGAEPVLAGYLDLSDEEPTRNAEPSKEEFAGIAHALDLVKVGLIVRGRASLVAAFCVVVIAEAVAAAVLVPLFALSGDAGNGTRAAAAGISASVVLCAGAVAVPRLFSTSRRRGK
jgi:hypothetical protein